jgi:hypothetical protein
MDPEIIDFVKIFVQWIIRGLELEFGIFNRLRTLKLEKLNHKLDAHIDPNLGPKAFGCRVVFLLM